MIYYIMKIYSHLLQCLIDLKLIINVEYNIGWGYIIPEFSILLFFTV